MGFVKNGDCISLIDGIPDESVHLIVSDIPYGISFDDWDVLHSNNNSALLGHSPAQEESGSVFKRRGKPLNGWCNDDKKIPLEYYQWCSSWAYKWLRVLKPGASCFIFAGRRYAHRCISSLEDAGFIFKDMLSWEKAQAAHRAQNVSVVLSKRNDVENAEKWDGWKIGNLRPLFEPILWFMKPYPQGTTLTDNILRYGVGAYNETVLKQNQYMNHGQEICSNIFKTKSFAEDRGLHEAQKPIHLMKTLIELTTTEGQIVLDPFMGSGSTLVAAIRCNRDYVGFERDANFFGIAQRRIEEELEESHHRGFNKT